jgi:two-component system, cell cycle response regulator CpdR
MAFAYSVTSVWQSRLGLSKRMVSRLRSAYMSTPARILIVDDHELIGIAFVEALSDAGYQAHAEQSALKAVQMATQCPFDVVFTDLLMPEMSGIEVCQAIKRACPKTQVVLISGHPEAAWAHRDAFLSAGGHAEILPKPIGIDTLLEVTQRLVPPAPL